MNADFISFGAPGRFQVSLAWRQPDEPANHRPKYHGWSLGALVLTVAGENLVAHRVGDHTQEQIVWYLGPLLHWLAENWVALFHEEHFAWPERSEEPAAVVCNRAIVRFASVGPATARSLAAAEAWYRRHGLASAATGGLFPDIFLRRFSDDVELSWTAAPPSFSPEGFTFETEAGVARLAIADVAEPLWQLLHWVTENPPTLDEPSFVSDWKCLTEKIDVLNDIAPERFNAAEVAETLLARVRASFREKGRDDLLEPQLDPGRRYVKAEAPAVAMFGGLSVDLSDLDIAVLRDALIAAFNGRTAEPLRSLVEDAPLRSIPWQDGYDLADDLLDQLEDRDCDLTPEGFNDIRSLCHYLGIVLDEKRLDTDTIRGVALAGEEFAPTILMNTRSAYNYNEDGRRFTIAHELCHILHDQSRARRLAHASGPWAAPGIEKRANAFAAWLLMPPRLLQRHMDPGARVDADRLRAVAKAMKVADSALAEHLFNLDLISETEREELRSAVRN
jgi:Zn-dependent peptidase ImmA (M78 family)